MLPLYHMQYIKAALMSLPRSLRPFFRKRSAPPLPSAGRGARLIIVVRFMRPRGCHKDAHLFFFAMASTL